MNWLKRLFGGKEKTDDKESSPLPEGQTNTKPSATCHICKSPLSGGVRRCNACGTGVHAKCWSGLCLKCKKPMVTESGAAPSAASASPEERKEQLIVAAMAGDVRKVEALLKDGADPNTRGEGEETVLMLAAVNGHDSVVRLLISKGANVNDKTSKGWTALMSAAMKGSTASAKLLIEAGADVKATNCDGITASTWAAMMGNRDIEQLLAK